jgi:hypothetical protein
MAPVGLLLIGSVSAPAAAQDVKPAIFASVAVANLSRMEDRSFGTKPNVGAGVGLEWRRLNLDAEVHRTIGLSPRAVSCGVVNVPCAGSAREGFAQATMLSGSLSYFFGRLRARPYVIGSAGVLWTASVNSLTVASATSAVLSEFEQRATSLAIGVGFGVDLPVTRALSLRPEFRTYSSVAMSSVNLDIHRGTIAARYRW